MNSVEAIPLTESTKCNLSATEVYEYLTCWFCCMLTFEHFSMCNRAFDSDPNDPHEYYFEAIHSWIPSGHDNHMQDSLTECNNLYKALFHNQ